MNVSHCVESQKLENKEDGHPQRGGEIKKETRRQGEGVVKTTRSEYQSGHIHASLFHSSMWAALPICCFCNNGKGTEPLRRARGTFHLATELSMDTAYTILNLIKSIHFSCFVSTTGLS